MVIMKFTLLVTALNRLIGGMKCMQAKFLQKEYKERQLLQV